MAFLSFVVPPDCDGMRLERFLRLRQLSGTTIKNARWQQGGLTMDGAHIRTVDPVRAGAQVRVLMQEAPRQYRPGAAVPVLYEDDDLLLLDKPAGMPCHPSKGHPCDTLANAFAALPQAAGLVFRAVGRLDADTSGIVLCARHAHAAYALGAIGSDAVQKIYLALVGAPPPAAFGCVDAPIARSAPDDCRRCVDPAGKRAVTRYRVLLADDMGHALLALRLETGRTHQIRVHMAFLGCPLAGDSLYGGDTAVLSRHALHCRRMQLRSPMRGDIVSAVSPLPQDMRAAALDWFGEAALQTALQTPPDALF